jgi:hypothetical protein
MVWLEKGGPAGFGWLKGARVGMVWLVERSSGWYGLFGERSLHVPDTSAVSGKKFVINWLM